MELTRKERNRIAQRKYYEKNKEKVTAKKRAKRLKAKDNIKKEEKVLTEQQKYLKAYYHMKKKHPNYKRLLKLRKIEPTQEELKLIDIALGSYLSNNFKTTGQHVNKEDVLGHAYEGLLVAIMNWDKKKNTNRNGWIVSKIKFHLIDCYRAEYGRKDSVVKRQIVLNAYSLNNTVKTDDGEMEVIDLLEGSNPDPSISMDADFFRQVIKEKIKSFPILKKNKKLNAKNLYEMIMMRLEHNHTLDHIAKEYGFSESRMSQVFAGYVNPMLEEIRLAHDYSI